MRTRLILTLLPFLVSFTSCLKPNTNTSFSESSGLSALTEDEQEEISLNEAINALEANVNIDPHSYVAESSGDLSTDNAINEEEVERIRRLPAVCRRAVVSSGCLSRPDGERSWVKLHFDYCRLPHKRIVLNGSAVFTYNNNHCSISRPGDLTSRQYNLTAYGFDRSSATVSSRKKVNYKRQAIGGGHRIENLGNGLSLNIPGHNVSIRNLHGRRIDDLQLHTRGAITMTTREWEGQAAQILDGGALAVDKNLAKYTRTYYPENLIWTRDCHCPVSGSLAVKTTGSQTGAGKITFLTCGKAEIVRRNGFTRTIHNRRCIKDLDSAQDAEPIDADAFMSVQ